VFVSLWSQLVYRVHPLPEAMVDYVWDYGRLHERDEYSYIENMLSDVFKGVGQLPRLAAKLVFESQKFIREKEEDCSVSLRDVRRFRTSHITHGPGHSPTTHGHSHHPWSLRGM